MSDDRDFFGENAFGDMYAGTFFEDEFPKRPPEKSADNQKEAAEIGAATAHVRLSNEIDAGQEANKAISSAYDLGGNLNGGLPPSFAGRIFGGI